MHPRLPDCSPLAPPCGCTKHTNITPLPPKFRLNTRPVPAQSLAGGMGLSELAANGAGSLVQDPPLVLPATLAVVRSLAQVGTWLCRLQMVQPLAALPTNSRLAHCSLALEVSLAVDKLPLVMALVWGRPLAVVLLVPVPRLCKAPLPGAGAGQRAAATPCHLGGSLRRRLARSLGQSQRGPMGGHGHSCVQIQGPQAGMSVALAAVLFAGMTWPEPCRDAAGPAWSIPGGPLTVGL